MAEFRALLSATAAARAALFRHPRRANLLNTVAPSRPLGTDPTFDTLDALVAWDAEECRVLSWARFAGPSAEPFIRAAIARLERVRTAHKHLIDQMS